MFKQSYIILVIFFLTTTLVSAQEAFVRIDKLVRSQSSDVFSARIVDIKKNSEVEFQILFENFTNEAIPSVRIVDVLPIKFTYISSSIPETMIEKDDNNTNILWILRAIQPREKRIITYKAKLIVDGRKEPSCVSNIASLVNNGKLVDSSTSEVCPLGKNLRILGSITTHPNTGIADLNIVQISLIFISLGIIGYFIGINKSSKTTFT